MKAIGTDLAVALAFAVLAVAAIFIGQKAENPYFIIAAAFAIATYVMYPPAWALQLVKLLPGKRNERK